MVISRSNQKIGYVESKVTFSSPRIYSKRDRMEQVKAQREVETSDRLKMELLLVLEKTFLCV